MEEELAKIKSQCISDQEHVELLGNTIGSFYARMFNGALIRYAQGIIGITELRDVLGLPPPGPWTELGRPSDDEIAAAPTIEEYFELKEPTRRLRRNNILFLSKNFPPAVAYLNKRFPAIRTIYRRKFKEIRRRPDAPVEIDRKEVDHMFGEFNEIYYDISDAIVKMNFNIKCL